MSTIREKLLVFIGLEGEDKFGRDMKKAKGSTEDFAKGSEGAFKSMSKSLKLLSGLAVLEFARMATAAVKSVVNMVSGAVDLAEQHRILGQSYQRLAIGAELSADKMLAAMKRGVEGTVKEMDLMKAANNAILLGLPVTAESMEELARVALRLGRAMGRTATEAITDLTIGIGRQSRLILDNLGIIVDTEKAYLKFAEANDLAADKLTDAQMKLAFYNEAMDAAKKKAAVLADVTGGLTERQAKLGVKWDEMTRKLGETFTPAAGAVISLTSQWADETQNLFDQMSAVVGLFTGAYRGVAEGFRRGLAVRNPPPPRAGQGRGERVVGLLPEIEVTAPRRTRAELLAGFSLGTARELREAGGVDALVKSWQAVTEAEIEAADEAEIYRIKQQNVLHLLSGRPQLRDFTGLPDRPEDVLDPIIPELDLDPMMVDVDEAIVPAFKAGPEAMEDAFEVALLNMGAQMQAFGLRGQGIFGGIANVRAGVTGLGGGKLQLPPKLAAALSGIAGVGQVLGGMSQAFTGLTSVMLAGSQAEQRRIGELSGLTGEEQIPVLAQQALDRERTLLSEMQALRDATNKFLRLSIAGRTGLSPVNIDAQIAAQEETIRGMQGGAVGDTSSQSFGGVTRITEFQADHLLALAETARMQRAQQILLLTDIRSNTGRTANNTGLSAGVALLRFAGVG